MTRTRRLGATLATTLLALVALSLGNPPAGAQPDGVEVTVQPGPAGVVPTAPRLPVRVTLRSESSRTVNLEVTTSTGSQFYRVELNSGAPTQTNAVMPRPSGRIEATVRTLDGDRLGSGEFLLDPKNERANVVGIGTSISGGNKPRNVPSIAKIDEATLIPLDSELLDVPGALDALGALVLGPGDVERLSDDQQRRVSAWVARGGNLALDQARTDPLPVLGTAAEAGDRTAVGTGWVRFTNGLGAKGDWSQVVEPAVAANGQPGQEQFIDDLVFGPDGMWNDMLGGVGFLQVSYLPAWVIGLAVLVTALLVGPVLWWALRSRKRRRLMWLAAPTMSLVVAGALLLAGRGALADASTTAIGSAVSTEWGTSGMLALGTTPDDSELVLGDQGEVWASKPRAVMTGSGTDRRAEQPLGTNDFGYAGIGTVSVDDGAAVSLNAVDRPDGKVDVSVTNHTAGPLVDVNIGGFSRQRGFGDVAAGATEKMEFEATEDLNPLTEVFPSSNVDGGCVDMFCTGLPPGDQFGQGGVKPVAARGRITVSGTLNAPLNVGGNSHKTSLYVTVSAPVVPPKNDPTAGAGTSIKVETVGEPLIDPNAIIDATGLEDDSGLPVDDFDEGGGAPPLGLDGLPSAEPPADMPTPSPATVVGAAQSDPTSEPLLTFVRISSPLDLPAAVCAAHTVIDDAQLWTGATWEPLPMKDGRFNDKRFAEPNEAQRYRLPAIKAGDAVFLRFTSNLAANPAAALNCSEAP